jgi:hypothetical protein
LGYDDSTLTPDFPPISRSRIIGIAFIFALASMLAANVTNNWSLLVAPILSGLTIFFVVRHQGASTAKAAIAMVVGAFGSVILWIIALPIAIVIAIIVGTI